MSDSIVTFDAKAIRGKLKEEAGNLVGADRYECTASREAYHAGHYERGLTTTSGQVTLRMPKLTGMCFSAAIIERYKRRKTSVEEAMINMCLVGASTRRIKDISKTLCGSSMSAAAVSNLNDKTFKSVEEWRSRLLTCRSLYVFINGIYLKRSWGGSYENASIMVAIGARDDVHREIAGAYEGYTESSKCWRERRWLKARSLSGAIIGDNTSAMTGAIA